jgi:hypothetical protein
MLVRVVLASVLAAVPLLAQPFTAQSAVEGQQEQEKPKPVPKDSLRVVITGCVKGRVIRAADVRQTDTTSGIDVRSKTFRLEGKREVMSGVKDVDGERAQITGLIKKSALISPGVSVMGGRVRIGGGTNGTAGSPGPPDPAADVLVLDVENVQALGGTCVN